jgi:hypothetical protein
MHRASPGRGRRNSSRRFSYTLGLTGSEQRSSELLFLP